METSVNDKRDYVMGHTSAELVRLQQQSSLYGELTEDVFRRAGLSTGMSVLDIGCGGGDVALLAGALVGPTGKVVGIDRAAEAVALARCRAQELGLHWVSFEVGDVAGLTPSQPFDALIGRLVLLHLADPVATLATLARHVKPGGIVAFQEMVIGTSRSEPEAPLFQQCVAWITTAFQRAGVRPDMGLQLQSTFERAGLPKPQQVAGSVVQSGPHALCHGYLAQTVRSVLPYFERLGVATPEQVGIETLEARLREEAASGGACLVSPMMIGAWCRAVESRS